MSSGGDFQRVVPFLKQALKTRKMTYAQLAKKLGMSEANVKRQMVARDCSIDRLNRICQVLRIPMTELLSSIYTTKVTRVTYSEEQQDLLCRGRFLVLYFKLAFEHQSLPTIQQALGITDREFKNMLTALEDVGLIEIRTGEQIKVNHADLTIWENKGSLAQVIKSEWGYALFKETSSAEQGPRNLFALRYYRLPENLAKELRTRFLELLDEFERRAHFQETIGATLEDVSCLVGIAPITLTDSALLQQSRKI